MKKSLIKLLVSLITILFAAGCARDEARKAAVPPTDHSFSGTSATEAAFTTASETEPVSQAKTTTEPKPAETEEREEADVFPIRAEEGKRVFEEGKKIVESVYPETDFHDYELLNKPNETEDPTLSDQIYRALYDFSVFFQYMDSQYLDTLAALSDEALTVESIGFYSSGGSETDRDFVRLVQSRYPRIKNGEITTIWEYYSRFFQVATMRFKDSEAHLFQKQFALSNGSLYYNAEAIRLTYEKASSGSQLNHIRKIVSENENERLALSFTACYEDFGTPYSEDYTVVLEYSDNYGWRIDECSDRYAVGHLYHEILEGGKNYDRPKTDLPGQIERCLRESGLM